MYIDARWPWLLQLCAVGLFALTAGLFGGVGAILAALYGGGVSFANTVLLIWRWRQGALDYHCDAGRHLSSFYRSSMERFFVVVILLAVGLAWLDIDPLALLAGFVVGQIAWMLASPTLRERT